MLQLLYKEPNRKPKWLVDPEYTVGVAATCGIVLNDSNLTSCHAKITVQNMQATVVNLAGDNHVRVNGVPVLGSRDIKPGDVLCFGTTQLELIDTRQAANVDRRGSDTMSSDEDSSWVLKPLGAALAGREFMIDKQAFVGRAKDCEISLGIAHLSRKHACLKVTDRGLQVEDLNSANGTFVNGQKIERAMLKPGDQVRFDSINFCVEGPHLDIEMTTVRPVLHVAKATVEKSTTAPIAAKPLSKPRAARSTEFSSRVSVNGEPYHGVVTASGATGIEEKPHRRANFGLWLIMGLLLSGIGWFFLH